MYYKKGRIGDTGDGVDEKLEERDDVDKAIKEFSKQFEEVTGNKFEPWEREKKIEKQLKKLFPIDMVRGHIILCPFSYFESWMSRECGFVG